MVETLIRTLIRGQKWQVRFLLLEFMKGWRKEMLNYNLNSCESARKLLNM